MIIGVPREIKESEGRLSVSVSTADQLVKAGHQLLIEKGAGQPSGFSDAQYEAVGARIIDSPAEIWGKADMVYKVKEPLESEYAYFRPGQLIFTYLHLASNRKLAEAMCQSGVVGVAYETVQESSGLLPLLKPMSMIAGRVAVQEGAHFLSKPCGGKGRLIAGIPGSAPSHVVVLGGGSVGTSAVMTAVGMGARVTVLDVNLERLADLVDIFGYRIETLYSNPFNIARSLKDADLVISTVLIPGNEAPTLVTEEMVKTMQPGSVVVDVAIDQGGTTDITKGHPTTLTDPVFERDGVLFYAVGNIPGAYPRTATTALSNATIYYALQLANKGWKKACQENEALLKGLNIAEGRVTYPGVAEALGMPCQPAGELVGIEG